MQEKKDWESSLYLHALVGDGHKEIIIIIIFWLCYVLLIIWAKNQSISNIAYQLIN